MSNGIDLYFMNIRGYIPLNMENLHSLIVSSFIFMEWIYGETND